MDDALIFLLVNLAASLAFIIIGTTTRISRQSRWGIGLAWVAIGILRLVTGLGAYDRLVGSARLATAYILLMPLLPWYRNTAYARRVLPKVSSDDR